MDINNLKNVKNKHRLNYIFRFISALFFCPILYYFNIKAILIFALVYIFICLIWIALVEFESKIILIEEFRYFRLTIDVVALTLITYMTGSINSFFVLGYTVNITLYSMYVTNKFGIFTIIMSFLQYNSLLLLIYYRVIPMINILSLNKQNPKDITIANVIITEATLLLFSLIVHIVVNRIYKKLQVERNKLQSYNIKMEQEVSLARRIQEQLIPSLNPAINIYSLYKPMDEVGGDFYDFIKLNNPDKIGIFLSDVSGHGVPAAFITSMIKTIILQAGDRVNDPANLLYYMNDILQSRTAGNFVTAFYGIYNQSDHSMLYSNAGHNQPYIILADKITQLQGGKNTAIAMFTNNMLDKANKKFVNYKENIPAGSKLLLYTDGLVEARPVDSDIFFEYANMENVFIDNYSLPCTSFVDNLLVELVKFRKSEFFEDDICVICIDIK